MPRLFLETAFGQKPWMHAVPATGQSILSLHISVSGLLLQLHACSLQHTSPSTAHSECSSPRHDPAGPSPGRVSRAGAPEFLPGPAGKVGYGTAGEGVAAVKDAQGGRAGPVSGGEPAPGATAAQRTVRAARFGVRDSCVLCMGWTQWVPRTCCCLGGGRA